ncbi:SDR family oxidoreductase [Streptomyces sp. VRA16 Mangrove soil]|uniref:SDR family oxidoreductase n=1 Tax=Streptomyces sp. VRA16 Mangrove soil TaxID=2817434 RepID=UPI001A9D9EB8|nr:NAD(P)H-binding protein [Streptomyces sp. VRA16 Mangrove soil]MBO1337862.1 NAD(P)H-binding protein [Streptomyces sp. VRA16 Mangrove soil]
MSRIAVAGATGTVGRKITARLAAAGHTVVPVSRAAGVDLHTGAGLKEALTGADAVIDAANAFPSDPAADVVEVVAGATRLLLDTARDLGVGRFLLVSICNIEDPVFDRHPYYVAKREQEKAVAASGLRGTVVKTTQWHEFATNPAAVAFDDSEVTVGDWLIQPVAADTVADVVAELVVADAAPAVVELSGPETVRLPELTARLLSVRGDRRPVKAVPAAIPELASGVQLAPASARIVGPSIEEWLDTQRVG